MKKYLVTYYSKTGNCKFLAEKASEQLGGDLREIRPLVNVSGLVLLMSALRFNIKTNISIKEIEQYDEVIIFGPIWAGHLIAPLKNVLNKCCKASKNIHFALSCETSDEDKHTKYGYAGVLEKAKDIGGEFLKTTEAFPTSLTKLGDESWKPKLSEKIKITGENFKGVFKKRFDDFLARVRSA